MDTSGPISTANILIGGILGLAGAPTFQRGQDVLDLIRKDHKTFFNLYDEYKQNKADHNKRLQSTMEFTKSLVQHSEVEQLILYPLLKMRGGNDKEGTSGTKKFKLGQELHDHALAEHQEIRELTYALDQTRVDDPTHEQKFAKVLEAVQHHMQEEEQEILPYIEVNYTKEERERLGNAFEVQKYNVATHPHPSAPAQGPFAAAVHLATKPIDMVRDSTRKVTEQK